jgi:hypothetical protein
MFAVTAAVRIREATALVAKLCVALAMFPAQEDK